MLKAELLLILWVTIRIIALFVAYGIAIWLLVLVLPSILRVLF